MRLVIAPWRQSIVNCYCTVTFRSIVEGCRDKFLAAVPESERSGLRWEHVGSTSIKGMPGTKFPDALLLVPEFPPSKGVIQAFLDCGYYFHASSHLDVRDLWWMFVFTDGTHLFILQNGI